MDEDPPADPERQEENAQTEIPMETSDLAESSSTPAPVSSSTPEVFSDATITMRTRSSSRVSAEEESLLISTLSVENSKEEVVSNPDAPTPTQSESPASSDSTPRAPSNPKSHPALPRPPTQSTQRPIFHIIAPRTTAPTPSDPRIILPRTQNPTKVRQFVPKQSEAVRPTRMRAFEPRQPRASYVRIDKPAVSVPRPRKPAPTTPVVSILSTPGASTKIPVKQTPKPVNLHHIPTTSTVKIPRPNPANSAPLPAVPGPSATSSVAVVRLPKSVTPQPAIQKRPKSVAFADDPQGRPPEALSCKTELDPSGTVPAERQDRQREAIEYLDEVKRKFSPSTYNTFLDVMKGFKMQDMDTIGVIRRVCYLFAAEPSLIAGFNGFLPQGYDIILNGPVITIKDRDGRLHVVDTSIDPNKPVPPEPTPLAQTPVQQVEDLAPRTFDNAVVFLQALKSRVSRKNYEKFLEIIKSCEGTTQLDPIQGKKMFQEVAQVLENDEDLLLGFSSFLPEMQQWCVSEFQKKQNYEANLTNKDYYWHVENVMRRLAENEENFPGSSLLKYKPMRSRPVRNLIQTLKVATTEDFVFFNKVRESIDNDRIFDNFCRVLRLYNNGLIDRHELLATCMPFFRGSPLLQAEFKKIIGFSEDYVFDSNADPSLGKVSRVDPDVKIEIDFTTLKRNGRSYRLLPEKYRHPKCSGRTRLCQEVLNDKWAIFPSWQSEETTRVSIKKSPFEEFLHRTEDERFEIDMLVQINTEAMAALERIKRLSMRNPRYEVDEKFECSSKTLMVRAVRRAYGENTQKVLDAMKKNPYLVSTTVLNRLKLKQREWKNMENAFKLVWEDQAKKYYQKMTTRKVHHMRKCDHSLLKGNLTLSVIQKLYKKRQFDGLKTDLGVKIERNKVVASLKFDWKVVYDINDLMIVFVKRQANISDSVKKQLKRFIRKVLPMVLDYAKPPDESEDDEEDQFPRKSISPRIFLCGDAFVHFIHLYQTVAMRLTKLMERARSLSKEESYKFNLLKTRQEIFKLTEKKLPSWCGDQWDVIEGYASIGNEKKRSLDRYIEYMSNLLGLLEGKITVSAYEKATKKLFSEDAFPALGLDKFIATLVKVLQNITNDEKQMDIVNKLWRYNQASSDPEKTKNDEYVLHEVFKILSHENIYEIAIYDQKEDNNSFMTIRMVSYAAPYADKSELFKTPEWKVYRRTYRQGLNIVKRSKKAKCRFKSKPLFLLRNLKIGWDRMGRFDNLKDEDFDSMDELIEETEDSDESISSTTTTSEESEIEIPKNGLINEWPYGRDERYVTEESESEIDNEEQEIIEDVSEESKEIEFTESGVQCGESKIVQFSPRIEISDVEMEEPKSPKISESEEEKQKKSESTTSKIVHVEETSPPGPSSSTAPTTRQTRAQMESLISEDECRRRINKFTSIQDYKLLKSEFRTVRIEPVSDTEHDYDDEVIVNFGASHMSGTMEDRIWWGTVLKIKRSSSSGTSSDSDDSSEKYRRKKLKKQRQRGGRVRDMMPRRRGSSTVRAESKSKKSTPSSSSPSMNRERDPLAELMKPAETQEMESSSEDEEEMLLPGPPRRYSSDEEEKEQKRNENGIMVEKNERDVDEIFDDTLDQEKLENELEDLEIARGHERDEEKNEEKETDEIEDDAPLIRPPEPRQTRSRSRSHSHQNKADKLEKRESKVSFDEDLNSERSPTSSAQKKPSPSASSVSRRSSSSSDAEPEPKKGKLENPQEKEVSDVEMTETGQQKQDSSESEDDDDESNEDEEEDEEEREKREELLDQAVMKQYTLRREKEKEKEANTAKKTYCIWMTKELSTACRADLCEQMIFVENKTAPNVMYRFGALNDAKNNQHYREIKLAKFDAWIEKTRCKQQIAGVSFPLRSRHEKDTSPDYAQAFKETNMLRSKERQKREYENKTARKMRRNERREEKRARKLAKHTKK